MNVFISYFYNIRFFPENMIPVSTAVYDPKWYHNFSDSSHIYVDNRNVYNGVRYPKLSPKHIEDNSCSELCSMNTENCGFMKAYRQYLDSLDFNETYSFLKGLSDRLRIERALNEEPDICLMVHEKPDNSCSERKPLVEWFEKNGVSVKEFEAKEFT